MGMVPDLTSAKEGRFSPPTRLTVSTNGDDCGG